MHSFPLLCFKTWILSILCYLMDCQELFSGRHEKHGNNLLINASATITNLMKNYDNRLRPKFGSGALNIGMELVIASFDSISEVNMDYTITVYLNQYWHDERLSFNTKHPKLMMTMPGDFSNEIWVPDTFLANDKYSFLHDVTEKNRMLRIYGNGDVFYGMRFTTTLACMMDLHYYPLDEQNCTVEIESYGYPLGDVEMTWRNGRNAVHNLENIQMIQFTLRGYDLSTLVSNLSTGIYQRLSLSFMLQRNIGFFVFQTYLPSILIVMLSWVSFWISHEATSARVALGITTVLTMTTISTGVRSSLPRISYVKAIDVYLVVCFAFVFSALLEYAAVNYTFWGERAKQKKRKLREEYERSQSYLSKASLLQSPSKSCHSDYIDSVNVGGSGSFTYRRKLFQDSQLSGQFVKPGQKNSNHSFRRNRKYNLSYRHYMGKLKRKLRSSKDEGQEDIQMSVSSNFYDISQNPQPIQAPLKCQFSSSKPMKLKIPSLRDVNVIDKYSRILFPTFFIFFNIGYFCIYSLL